MSELATLFVRQNEYANIALLDACRDLTDEQLDTTTNGVYGSIRDTWGHIVSSELYYATLLGQNVGTWDDENDDWPGWDDLAGMIRRAADGLAIAATEPPDRRVRSSSGKWDIEASVVIVQAVHHGADHRSQINTLLTELGLEPAEFSSWAWGEDTGKMHPLETDTES
jgi:uncharacterized damage-inducible protein DinB